MLMAKAAAMATAATIIRLLNMNQVSFLTDNQALVNFFNGVNLDNPPHWEIKPFTQSFLNEVSNKQIQVLKIARNLNTTAHSLAGQAFRHPVEGPGIFTISCTNGNHAKRCPLSEALQSIVKLLYPSCIVLLLIIYLVHLSKKSHWPFRKRPSGPIPVKAARNKIVL